MKLKAKSTMFHVNRLDVITREFVFKSLEGKMYLFYSRTQFRDWDIASLSYIALELQLTEIYISQHVQ